MAWGLMAALFIFIAFLRIMHFFVGERKKTPRAPRCRGGELLPSEAEAKARTLRSILGFEFCFYVGAVAAFKAFHGTRGFWFSIAFFCTRNNGQQIHDSSTWQGVGILGSAAGGAGPGKERCVPPDSCSGLIYMRSFH